MQVTFYDKHMRLSESQREYVQEKIEHLKHFSDRVDDESTQVKVEVEAHPSKISNKDLVIQVTMFVPNGVIRAEVPATTVEEGIDIAVSKLKKQIARYKTKKSRRNKEGEWIPSSTLEQISATAEVGGELAKISKRKNFTVDSMHEEEAIEQLELLDHNFYVFFLRATVLFLELEHINPVTVSYCKVLSLEPEPLAVCTIIIR